MKLTLFAAIFAITAVFAQSRSSSLPIGKYETLLNESNSKWSQGDIILLDVNRYKTTTNEEVGEYKFSATAQRVFFVSGPLKAAFARTILDKGEPTIVLPLAENEQQGLKLAPADVFAYLKK